MKTDPQIRIILLGFVYLLQGAPVARGDLFNDEEGETLLKPSPGDWIHGRHPNDKLNLISWIVDGCFYYTDAEATPPPDGIEACPFAVAPDQDSHPPEYASFDGFFNNVFKTDLGAIDTPLLRRVPPAYADGTYEPVRGKRINPFTASDRLMKRSAVCGHDDEGRTVACGSKTGKSAFLVFFGQQVVEEVLDAQRAGCPVEYFNVPIPEDHEFGTTAPGKSVMPFVRSRYAQSSGSGPGNPRQQLNEITPWFDGGLIYGTAKGWADVLRTFPNGSLHPEGQLASDEDAGYFPARNTLRLPLANPPPPAFHSNWVAQHETANVNRFFVLGNPRGNENAFLLSFGVVLFRWHNQFAAYLHATRPAWSGERVFQEARKWATATYNSIVYNDWLPQWLGEALEPYRGYNPASDPQIEQFFQTAAMRFGHTLVTPGAYMRDYACTGCKRLAFYGLGGGQNPGKSPGEGAVRTCNIFWRPQEPLEMPHEAPTCLATDPGHPYQDDRPFADIDRLLMGMASQRAEREDNMIVEDLRGRVFGPLEFSRRDLMAINIQRGRDHGTPDYNTARAAFGLPRIRSIEQYINLTQTATPTDILETMVEIHRYGNESAESAWDNIDVWTGGILETSDRPGPLFRAIIKDQFSRIRDADRFWFENTNWDGNHPRFSLEQIDRIKSLKVFDMVVSVTRMTEEDLQPNPFRVPNDEENRLSCLDDDEDHPLADADLWRNETCNQTVYDVDGNLVPNATVLANCFFLLQLDSEQNPVEECTPPGTYDYFSGSELSFIFTWTALGLVVAVMGGALLPLLARRRSLARDNSVGPPQRFTTLAHKLGGGPLLSAREWTSAEEEPRAVAVAVTKGKLELRSMRGELLRDFALDRSAKSLEALVTSDGSIHAVVLKDPNSYDLSLQFDGPLLQAHFLQSLADTGGGTIARHTVRTWKALVPQIVTKAQRLSKLQPFFRVVFQMTGPNPASGGGVSSDEVLQAQAVKLTRAEFASALGMDSSSSILAKMFDLADQDQDGLVTFLEFFTMLSIFKKGSAEEKLGYIFKMYDTDGDGVLSRAEFDAMLRALLALQLADEDPDAVYVRVLGMLEGELGQKARVSLDDFRRIFGRRAGGYISVAEELEEQPEITPQGARGRGVRASYIQSTRDSVFQLLGHQPGVEETGLQITPQGAPNRRHRLLLWFEVHHLHVFWLTLFNLVALAVFAERSYYYSVENEHRGFRHIAGMGVSITRGAASVQMLCYAALLLTMCRNLITQLRDSWLARFIPFESALAFHKWIAGTGLAFTVLHVIGHSVNFYNISTQPADDLACTFRDFFRPTHVLPKFQYWAFGTVTGLSGILLTLHATVIFTFASPIARRHAYRLFWLAHQSYPLWYALMLLHGSGQLVQAPLFLNFLIGPVILFVYDKLITFSRQFAEIAVLDAALLPSGVIRLLFVRPTGFEYRSGQWVRLACSGLNSSEFHPFTLSSAPHEPVLSVHIRAVGPFTHNLRQLYESSDDPLPSLRLDGPYGESHQDWHRYEVSVLVGGGIGVTPFASILKDAAARTLHSRASCKKVYFLWVTRSQKQFEWLVDIVRDVEVDPMISVHIFITSSGAQFDLRTLLLYVFERDFQKINNKSLLTGLKSKTHFGRPDFPAFFQALKVKHRQVTKFGVFACGPPPMAKSVEDACRQANTEATENGAEFRCHLETF